MKKNKRIELDVDFIGGLGPLTKEDANVISEYIRNYKAKHSSNYTEYKKAHKTPARNKKLAV